VGTSVVKPVSCIYADYCVENNFGLGLILLEFVGRIFFNWVMLF
jgi:hypothetical protein